MIDRRKLIIALAIGTAIGAPGRVSAAEPNEVFELATLLPDGQTALDDNLNAADGRLDTLLGHFDLTFLNLLASDDNSSKFGNGWASGLNGLPLTPDGSLFIKVTGAENTLFSPDTNSHTEFGFYQGLGRNRTRVQQRGFRSCRTYPCLRASRCS